MSGPSNRRSSSGFSFSRLGSGSAPLDAGLRSVLLQQRTSLTGVALPAAARTLSGAPSGEDLEAMLKRLRSGRSAKAPRADGSAVSGDLDSAQQTEASELGSDSGGLLALMDEGWFIQQPGRPGGSAPAAHRRGAAPPAGGSFSRQHSESVSAAALPSRSQSRSSARAPSPLDLPAGEPAVVGDSGSPSSALTRGGSWPPPPPSDSMYSAREALPAAPSLSAAESVSGWESPRSWATSQLSLPQAALDNMELSQLELLAAEAAALQQRAALAMQFARQRMGPPTAGLLRPIGEDSGGAAVPGPADSAPAASAAPAPTAATTATQLPSLVQLAASLLQILLLLALGLLLSAAARGKHMAQAVLGSPSHAVRAAARWAVQAWTAALGLLLALAPVKM